MINNTKTGLLLLIIGFIIGMISTILLFIISFYIEITNIDDYYLQIIPALIPAIIGGLIVLIGAVLIVAGRKDYGEKHSRFVIYAIIIFVINIIFGAIISAMESFFTYTSTSNLFFGQSTSYDPTNLILIITVQLVVTSILGGLMYIFLLYNLENRNGKSILIVAFTTSVIFAFVMAIYNYFTLNDLFTSIFTNSASYTSILNYVPNISKISILGIIGNIFFIISAYIPYKMIISGELSPVLPSYLKRCTFCGRPVPVDSVVCAYCGKSFYTYR